MIRIFTYILLLLLTIFPASTFGQTWLEVNKQANNAFDNEDYASARRYYEEGLILAKKEYGSKSVNYSIALTNYSILLCNNLGEFEKAEGLLLEALEIRKKKLGDKHPDYGTVLSWLGTCYQAMGQYTKAAQFYLESAEINKIVYGALSNEYAADMNDLGLVYQRMGKYEEAEQCLIHALGVRKDLLGEKDRGYIVCLSNLALLYLELGRFKESEKMFLKVMETDKLLLGEDHPEYGTDLINLAGLYSETGENEKAEQFYLQGMNVWRSTVGEKSQQYASALNNLAEWYKDIGDLEKAEQYFLQCTSISLEVYGKSHPEYAAYLSNLAGLYMDMGKIDESYQLYREALIIQQTSLGEDHPSYARTLNGLGLICYQRDQYPEAEALYIQSLKIYINTFGQAHPLVAKLLLNVGSLYISTNDLEKAEEIYTVSANIIKESGGENTMAYMACQYGLGKINRILRKWDQSDEYFKKCTNGTRDILGEEHPDYAQMLRSYGILKMRSGDLNMAGSLFEKSDSVMLNYLHKIFRFTSETEKAKYIFTLKTNFDRSQTCYLSSIKTRPTSSLSALNLHLATNGLVLQSVAGLRESIFMEGGDSAMKLYSSWELYNNSIAAELSKPIAERNAQLSDWNFKANQLEKDLNKLSQSFQKVSSSVQPTYSGIQKNLKPDEAAIEFISFTHSESLNDSVIYAAIITRSEDSLPIYVPLFDEVQLTGLLIGDSIRTFANLLYTHAQVRNAEHDVSYGDSLYQLIWKPLAPYLMHKKSIYYSPSGILHKINFEAIPVNQSIVLSDQYSMHRLTTTGKLMNRGSGGLDLDRIAIFGGIQYHIEVNELKKLTDVKTENHRDNHYDEFRSIQDSSSRNGFNYLSGSETEVRNIYALLQDHHINAQLFAGKEGSEEAVKNLNSNKSLSILHLSTHGFFFPDPQKRDTENFDDESAFTSSDNPLFRSGLIMAGAEYVWKGNEPIAGVEDGILTAYEVSNMYLPKTKLVVLSACETGLGDVKGSEGVYGLQRAFKMAGVEYIIVTLWQVLDKETSEFMILFYQNLLVKKSIPDAFKMTQDAMKNKYREEPYKWAGFVLIH
jgi:CHAT domain-containing protein/Tfp pilus assembly protein PilF